VSDGTTPSHAGEAIVERSGAIDRRPPERQVVAVTGASSFLGANLIGMLEEDDRIRRIVCLDVKAPPTARQRSRLYELDLTQPHAEEKLSETLAAEGVDTVAHLGFLSSPAHATQWAHELESVGTLHLLNACRRTRVRKVVMLSQTFLYGAHPTNPNFLSERHPLRALRNEPFFADKLDAEEEVLRFGKPGQGRIATVLRMAPILGPNFESYLTRYLGRRLVPTVMGFDPLWQFLHEADAVAAFRLAIVRDAPGVLNIVGDGVLPLHTVIRLVGRSALPLPRSIARSVAGALWIAQLGEMPASLCDYLQYLCVADGRAAHARLGFSPLYTSREAVIEFGSAQRLRDVRLLSETAA
jgi:UDP-glucose 4-epimerase